MVMEQPDGLPLHHICHLVGHAAWLRYITLKKKENGSLKKVSGEKFMCMYNGLTVWSKDSLYASQAKSWINQ